MQFDSKEYFVSILLYHLREYQIRELEKEDYLFKTFVREKYF